jgi:aldose sugar dehydrogenase
LLLRARVRNNYGPQHSLIILRHDMNLYPVSLVMTLVLVAIILTGQVYHIAYAQLSKEQTDVHPRINNENLKAEIVYRGGLNFPAGMAFLGPGDIVVLEKNSGEVRRIINGSMLSEPLLTVPVANKGERGLLGISVVPRNLKDEQRVKEQSAKTMYVFLYYSQPALEKDEKNKITEAAALNEQRSKNSIYRYELIDNKLVNPKLLFALPSTTRSFHNGGAIVIGPDNNLYIAVGEAGKLDTKARNVQDGSDPFGTSGILRLTQDGTNVGKGILGDKYPVNLYYAYGIRNSFGIDFDPLTGNLWNTENGPFYGDEINLVEPGFNSGWEYIQGIWEQDDGKIGGIETNPEGRLVSFEARGKYSDPELTSKESIGFTAIKFLDSDKLGESYRNDAFVGDFHHGKIYHFDLNESRTGFILGGSLQDRIANDSEELETRLFGEGFGGITDMEVGPDGYLYVLALYRGGGNCSSLKESTDTSCISYDSNLEGTIFRIIPACNVQ